MGNCVTLQKSSDPALEFKYSDPPGKRNEIESPVKENTVITQQSSLVPFERSFRDMSERDEMFFDSQPWLDSDCEDYLSVNGDSDNTPSCGTTPAHHSSCIETSAKEKAPFVNAPPHNSTPETPPTEVKKLLIELFRESFGSDHGDKSHNEQGSLEVKPVHLYPKSADRSPYKSGPHSSWSAETSPNIGSGVRKQQRAHTSHRCLPNLVRSFSEKRRRSSPARSVGIVK